MVKDKRDTPAGWSRLWLIAGIVFVLAIGGWLLNQALDRQKSAQQPPLTHEIVPEANGDKTQPTQLEDDSSVNQGIITSYISNFLTQGYAKYSAIQRINHRFVSQEIKRGQLEAVVMTTMRSRPKNPASDPDTVPYIKEAKEKAQKESDPERKKMLQEQYETMKKEYGRAEDSNYTFKFTADVVQDKIDENSIKLYIVQDAAPNHTVYMPAEDILPR